VQVIRCVYYVIIVVILIFTDSLSLACEGVFVQAQDLSHARSAATMAHACRGDGQSIAISRNSVHLLLSPEFLHEQGLCFDHLRILVAGLGGGRGSTLVQRVSSTGTATEAVSTAGVRSRVGPRL